MDEYISLFKLYPDVFPSGYFKFLKSSLQKHIDSKTLIYKNGVLLTYKIYKKNTKRYKKGQVKICQLINKNPGNGESQKIVKEFLKQDTFLEVKADNNRAITFYNKLGFRQVGSIFFNSYEGIIMEFKISG